MNQKEIAKAHFNQWLNEKGLHAIYLEAVNQFLRGGLAYYVMEFALAGSELFVGVAGGYEEDSVEHCGHIFSRMEVLEEGNEIQQAIELVDAVEDYWSAHARIIEENFRKNAEEGHFISQVLLASFEWDFESLKLEMAERWNVQTETEASAEELSFEVENMHISLKLKEGQLAHHEAEINASSNTDWPDALEIVKAHRAYLEVSVISGLSRLEAGKMMVKLLSCCSMQDNVLAISTLGTVFEPGYYDECSDLMKEGQLPVYNMVHFGFYRTNSGLSCYTYGMKQYGELEIEVLDTLAEIEDLHEFISTLAYSVLMGQIDLKHGNKISVAEGHELMVTEGMSEALNEMTLKVEYLD